MKKSLKQLFSAIPGARPAWQRMERIRVLYHYLSTPLRESARWLVQSRETTNFTYDLSPLNQDYLAWFVAHITGKQYKMVRGYIQEMDDDEDIRGHIKRTTLLVGRGRHADPQARFGRRMGWYAVVRATKPGLVIETGVDKGLGAVVLAAALKRNQAEGFSGSYIGTDINPAAGFLFSGEYARFGKILYGDSISSLTNIDQPVDLFIHDSNHDPAYEAGEYNAVCDKLSLSAIILSDNAHVTGCLARFAQETGREFLFFQEQPFHHWYPGAGIGAAFRKDG